MLTYEPRVIDTAWLGLVPYAYTGSGSKVGSTRSSTLAITEGVYNVTEKLTKLTFLPNGAFIQRFEQLKSTLPLEYYAKNGSFQGYWITFETKSVFEYETAIVSSVYTCATGHPLGESSCSYLRYYSGQWVKRRIWS